MRAPWLAVLLVVAAVPAVADASQDDCGSGGDAARGADGAPQVRLASPMECLGHVGAGDDSYDVYEVVVGPYENVRVTLTPDAGMLMRFSLMSFGPGPYRAWAGTYGDVDDVTAATSIDVHRLGTGDVVQIFVKDRDTPGAYRLRVEPGPQPPAQDDCGSGGDAGDATATALPLPARVDCTGRVVFGPDLRDVYTFAAKAGAGMHVALDGTPWCLRDPTGDVVHCSEHEWNPPTYRGIAETSGTWTIEVLPPYEPQDYAIHLAADGAVTRHRGDVLAGHALGAPLESLRGPHDGEGVDGQWVRLAHATRAGDALRFHFEGTSSLSVSYRDAAGTEVDGCRPHRDFDVWCLPPPGVTWLLVWTGDILAGPITFEIDHVTYA